MGGQKYIYPIYDQFVLYPIVYFCNSKKPHSRLCFLPVAPMHFRILSIFLCMNESFIDCVVPIPYVNLHLAAFYTKTVKKFFAFSGDLIF